MSFLTIAAVVFALLIVVMLIQSAKAGKSVVSEDAIRKGSLVCAITPESPGEGWQELGIKTTARGLDLRFDHDDDPQASATLLFPGYDLSLNRSRFGQSRTITLTSAFATHHVQNSGYVFRVSLRGTGDVIDRQVRIKMVIDGKKEPFGGSIENDDDTAAAVGDWVEVERAELLKLADSA